MSNWSYHVPNIDFEIPETAQVFTFWRSLKPKPKRECVRNVLCEQQIMTIFVIVWYGNFKTSSTFWPGDVIDNAMSMEDRTCTTRHHKLYSCKIWCGTRPSEFNHPDKRRDNQTSTAEMVKTVTNLSRVMITHAAYIWLLVMLGKTCAVCRVLRNVDVDRSDGVR